MYMYVHTTCMYMYTVHVYIRAFMTYKNRYTGSVAKKSNNKSGCFSARKSDS